MTAMLVRVFRLTDKFSNAFLKIAVWLTNGFLDQVVFLRLTISALIIGVVGTVVGLTQRSVRVSQQAQKQVVRAAAATEERRKTMAQRATALATRTGEITGIDIVPTRGGERVIEDPLLQQNRLLSSFAVVLMIALIGIVLWATSREVNDPDTPFVGLLPQNTLNPTAVEGLPTPIPPTPIPAAVFSDWQGTLAFTIREAGQQDIFTLQRGDTQPRRLTNNPADDRDPAWSPDGRAIAFTSNREGTWQLYIMDAVTRRTERMTSSTHFVGAPTWSPDGAFLAFEGYNPETAGLDIYIMPVDRSRPPEPITTRNPGPDFEPAWEPTAGRAIAYTSIRGAQQDIYVLNLDNPNEFAALNLTNTPEIHEDFAAWSPDGTRIAYSARVNGTDNVFARALSAPESEVIVGRGVEPTWNPIDGSSVFYTQALSPKRTTISGGFPGSFGTSGNATIVNGIVSDLNWTGAEPEVAAVVASYPPVPPIADSEPDADGRYRLARLPDVLLETDTDAYLNALVFPAFAGLRQAAIEKLGWDFLALLESAFWDPNRRPESGQSQQSWHYTGRAFSVQRDFAFEDTAIPQMVIVREDAELGTYWRVYVRVTQQAQNGALGEPLRRIPWDLLSRTSGDVAAFESGGQLSVAVPGGYYVDFTQLAADYEFYPIPSEQTWRANTPGLLFWQFVKADDLLWRDAMSQLYSSSQVQAFLNEDPADSSLSRPDIEGSVPEPAATERPTEVPTETTTDTTDAGGRDAIPGE